MEQQIIQQLKNDSANQPLIDEILLDLRKQGASQDLFEHSLKVADGLRKIQADEKTIAAGLLSYLPEGKISLKSIGSQEQNEIFTIAKKVNQLKELYDSFRSLKAKPIGQWQKIFLNTQAENLRKMFFALTQDLRPIFILLADKLIEIKDPRPLAAEEKQRQALTALEILSPLAYGLGMGEIKGQLEDLTFPILYPKEYNWLIGNVKEHYMERKNYLDGLQIMLPPILQEEQVSYLDIHKRAKYYFSLYQKLLRYNMDMEKIYDLVALRIIVNNVEDCYQALGALHKNWSPLPGRIKDYVSAPKPNGYRSLHTTIISQDNKITEFQIKTEAMHKEAEYGAAAHLSYKEQAPLPYHGRKFYWLDQLRQWREETKDTEKITEYLKTDLFKGRIFVFTPQKEVINLPKDSTPVDFAYAVHSSIGDHCEGAKINGQIIPINRPLKTGETIEIITSKNQMPSEKWLRFVKTRKARVKIRKFLENAHGFYPKKTPLIASLAENITRRVELFKRILPLTKKGPSILIAGQAGISFKLSQCCKPKPSDSIVAFITQGEGASVHKINCENLRELEGKWPQKIIPAIWQN